MKKLYFLLILSLLAFAPTQAQCVKIIKDGNVIATYSAADFDQVVFSPEAADISLAGTYKADITVTLVEMDMGILVQEATEFTVAVAEDGSLSIDLPQCFYEAMNEMLPAVSITGIAAEISDGSCTFAQEYSGIDASNEKEYSGTISGRITSPSDFEIVETMKYGKMPFSLKMVYTPITIAE